MALTLKFILWEIIVINHTNTTYIDENIERRQTVKKLMLIITICSFFALLLAACGADRSGDAASGGSTSSNQVQMNDTQFMQSSITIHKGESITLVSTTFTPHIIANGTWDNGQAKAAKEAGAPEVKNVQINGNSS